MSIILASASPRRAELLRQLRLEFEIAPMDVDESRHENEGVRHYVQRIANDKADAARNKFIGREVIIAADTVVCIGEDLFAKPVDQADGLQMLASLSGQTHIVLTAVVVSQAGAVSEALSKTEVTFREVSAAEAQRYWQTGEPLDKAGGYAIQGIGAMFVSQIRGSYSGVVGLPLFELTQLLSKTNVSVV